MLNRTPVVITVLVFCFMFFITPIFAANIVINNVDQPGEGLNDTTPALPVGGNDGTTLGELRLNLMQRAFEIWSATLDSDVDIVAQVTFVPQECTETSAVLASAGTLQIFRDFENVPFESTWYVSALANALAGEDLSPGEPDSGLLEPPYNDDIVVYVNSNIDDDETCLGGIGWYYGFDHNEGQAMDLLAVILHELAHGLGFTNLVDTSTGEQFLGYPDIYSSFIYDVELAKFWNDMGNFQRRHSAKNDPNVVWVGGEVSNIAPNVLNQASQLTINSPGTIAGNYDVGTASFGPEVPASGLTNNVVLANDGTGTVTDGCEGPLVNSDEINGNIALIDRGDCLFVEKVKNAQNAGAVAVLIADNTESSTPPNMSGSDDTITIPTYSITMALGTSIKGQLQTNAVNVTLGYDENNFAGMNEGFVRLYAPNPIEPGSSISHWATECTPSLLMEPSITSGLTDDLDLTVPLFEDIGWDLNSWNECDLNSDGTFNRIDLLLFLNGCKNNTATWTCDMNNDGSYDRTDAIQYIFLCR